MCPWYAITVKLCQTHARKDAYFARVPTRAKLAKLAKLARQNQTWPSWFEIGDEVGTSSSQVGTKNGEVGTFLQFLTSLRKKINPISLKDEQMCIWKRKKCYE